MNKVGLQLYSVREELAKDFEGTIAGIAEMGYAGVETAGLPEGIDYKTAKEVFNRYKLETPSAFTPLPLGDEVDTVLKIAADLGCKKIVSGKNPECFSTIDAIKSSCKDFNLIHDTLKAHNLTFLIHNHAHEFNKIDGRYVFDIMLDQLAPDICFELDVYWAAVAGADSVIIEQNKKRIPQIHVKDGPCEAGKAMQALGQGQLDLAPIIKNADACEWIMVELDNCESSMMDAVKQSIDFLQTNLLK